MKTEIALLPAVIVAVIYLGGLFMLSLYIIESLSTLTWRPISFLKGSRRHFSQSFPLRALGRGVSCLSFNLRLARF